MLNSNKNLLIQSSLRYFIRHPWQIGLSILGIALGVAVVVSVDLANQSAGRAFELSMESVAGKATHQIIGSSAGLPDSLYRILRIDLRMRESAPIVEKYVSVGNSIPRSMLLLENLIITDISTAQELLDMLGQLSRIDLILPENSSVVKQIESVLPPGARMLRSDTRTRTAEQMVSAFNLNLTAQSLLALVVGMFLIYKYGRNSNFNKSIATTDRTS